MREKVKPPVFPDQRAMGAVLVIGRLKKVKSKKNIEIFTRMLYAGELFAINNIINTASVNTKMVDSLTFINAEGLHLANVKYALKPLKRAKKDFKEDSFLLTLPNRDMSNDMQDIHLRYVWSSTPEALYSLEEVVQHKLRLNIFRDEMEDLGNLHLRKSKTEGVADSMDDAQNTAGGQSK